MTDVKRLWNQELMLARSAVGRGEPVVARSHFLRAILGDSSTAARGEYAAFLVGRGEYAGAIAEYSRMLEIAEKQGDFAGLIEIAWGLAGAYRGKGELSQAAYFLDYAVMLEGNLLVYHQAGIEFTGSAAGDLRRVEMELGRQLLGALGAGNATQEGILWLSCGILEWLQGGLEESLRSLKTGLRVVRKLRRSELEGDFFLWIGRVCHGWGEAKLGQLSIRRSAAWGGEAMRSRRELELEVREKQAGGGLEARSK